eukprot:350255-Chlamydomonas_euryale.AAC.33
MENQIEFGSGRPSEYLYGTDVILKKNCCKLDKVCTGTNPNPAGEDACEWQEAVLPEYEHSQRVECWAAHNVGKVY